MTSVDLSQILFTDPGVDWITSTSPSDKVGYAWYDEFCREAKRSTDGEVSYRPWSALGYNGQSVDHLKWGYSNRHGYIIIASSSTADRLWAKLVPPIGKVTRLDLRTDVYLDSPWEQLATSHYNARPEQSSKVKNYAVIQNSQGGNTLYVGSRQSTQYGRIYDKSAERGKKPGMVWRYEVELHKPKAMPMAESLYHDWEIGNRRWGQIAGYIYQWFDARGVTPIFRKGLKSIKVDAEYSVTTTERKLTWLRTQVSPTIDRLIKAGLGKEVVQALGLAGTQISISQFASINHDE